MLHLDLGRVSTIEQERERMVGTIPVGGGAHKTENERFASEK